MDQSTHSRAHDTDVDRKKDAALRDAFESTRLYTTAVILAGEYSLVNS